ncbi:MAG: GntR family transcriptional regulator [Pseudomonadota bacterium]
MVDRKKTCAESLRRRVLQLSLAPGDVLEEAALSAEFGLSRTPVREVLQLLVSEGYLVHEARSTVVARMDLETMRAFFQTAPLLYATVSRLAAENRRDMQLAELTAIQRTFRSALMQGQHDLMVVSNYEFHAYIGTLANNNYLQPSLHRLLIDHTRMSHRFYRPRHISGHERVARAADDHDELIEAIAARDVNTAVDVTLRHWDLSRNELEKYVRPDPVPLDLTDTNLSPATVDTH